MGNGIELMIEEILRNYSTIPLLDTNNDTIENVQQFLTACDPFLKLSRGPVEIFLYRWFLPIQIVFGIVGNTINLAVLLSSGMRSEANVLLSAMAFMDIALLVCHMPYLLTVYPYFYQSPTFRNFYFSTHIALNSMANIFSASASWLVLAVSLERYIGIRSPMHTRFQWHNSRVFLIILLIFVGACTVCFYHFFEHHYEFSRPDPSKADYSLLFLPPDSPHLKTIEARLKAGLPPPRAARIAVRCYAVFPVAKIARVTQENSTIQFAKFLSICLVVIVPIIFIPIFNLSIIRVLRNRDILVNRTYISAAPKGEDFVRHYSEIGIRQRQERKVTATVVAIITCHIFTHSPSAVPFIWDLMSNLNEESSFWWLEKLVPPREPRFISSIIINSFLLWGKVMNFVLFCLSSEHFRRRMFMMFRIHCVPARTKKYSSVASNSQIGTYKGSSQPLKLNRLRGQEIHRQNSCTTQIQELTMNDESTC